jgi:hypothetical protein
MNRWATRIMNAGTARPALPRSPNTRLRAFFLMPSLSRHALMAFTPDTESTSPAITTRPSVSEVTSKQLANDPGGD